MGDSNEVSSKIVFYLCVFFFLLVMCMRIMWMRGSSGPALKGLPVIDAVWRERDSPAVGAYKDPRFIHTWHGVHTPTSIKKNGEGDASLCVHTDTLDYWQWVSLFLWYSFHTPLSVCNKDQEGWGKEKNKFDLSQLPHSYVSVSPHGS